MKKAGLYIRVSTPEQEKNGYSLNAQEEKLKSFALAKDYEVTKVYRDGGFSGAKLERPAMLEMIDDIENNKLDLVLVYKLDRLSRSQKNTMYLIEDVFLKNNVDFISMQESFDTTTSFGRAMIGILSVFAQLERDNIRERMTLGRMERIKRGFYMGGGKVSFGYRYNQESNMLEIDGGEAMAVKRMFELFLAGNSIYSLINTLKNEFPQYEKTFYDASVRRRLANEHYIGNSQYDGKIYVNTHEPIIDDLTFNQAQLMLSTRSHGNAFKHKYLFSGMITCQKCGKSYNGFESVCGKYSNKYYRCSSTTYKFKKKNGWECSGKRFRCEDVDKYILDKIKSIATDQVVSKKSKSTSLPIKKEIDKLKAQQAKLLDLYLDDRIDTIVLDEKSKHIKDLLEKLNKQLKEKPAIEKKVFDESVDKLANNFESLSFEQQRILIGNVIEKIEVVGGDMNVYFFDTK